MVSQRRSYKRWRDALRLEVMREHEDGGVKLGHIARAVVKRAIAGDMQAVREIGNRLDGRPVQRLELDGQVSLVGLLAQLSGADRQIEDADGTVIDAARAEEGAAPSTDRGLEREAPDNALMPPRSPL